MYIISNFKNEFFFLLFLILVLSTWKLNLNYGMSVVMDFWKVCFLKMQMHNSSNAIRKISAGCKDFLIKQGITNTLALPIGNMLYIYVLCPHSEHQNNPFQSKQSKHFHQRNQFA
jgi:hypothetical protein